MTKIREKKTPRNLWFFTPHCFIHCDCWKKVSETGKASTQSNKILQIGKVWDVILIWWKDMVEISLNVLHYFDPQNFQCLCKYLIFNWVVKPLYICDFKLGCIFKISLMLKITHTLVWILISYLALEKLFMNMIISSMNLNFV